MEVRIAMEHVTEDCTCSGKWCRKCQRMLCVGEYNKDKSLKSGLKSACRLCCHVAYKKWRENNREYDELRHKIYAETHPELLREYERKYWKIEANHERKKTHRRKKYRENINGFRDRLKASSRRTYYRYSTRTRRHGLWHNPEYRKQRALQYYHTHKEESQERWNQYYQANKFQLHQKVYQWRKDNPSGHAAINNRRRTRKTQAGGSYTIAEWEALKAQYDYKCLRCGRDDVKLTADHVLPISLLGSSDIGNIQPLCKSCNSWKHNKFIDFRPKKLDTSNDVVI